MLSGTILRINWLKKPEIYDVYPEMTIDDNSGQGFCYPVGMIKERMTLNFLFPGMKKTGQIIDDGSLRKYP